MSVLRTKSVEQSLADAEEPEFKLKRSLSALDLIVFGVGVVIGAGIFTLTGRAAHDVAGPGIVLSFVVAAICCALAAMCYAEFASTVPVSGSAYTFSYSSLGEIFAWIIGWDLILEMFLGASVVAQGWSAYLGVLLENLGFAIPDAIGVRRRRRPSRRSCWSSCSGCSSPSGSRSRCGSTSCSSRSSCSSCCSSSSPASSSSRRRTTSPFIPPAQATETTTGLTQPLLQAIAGLEPTAFGVGRGRRRRGARVLRVHRVRRRRDDRRGDPQPAAGPAHRDHRVAHHLHDPVLRGLDRRDRDGAATTSSTRRPRWPTRSRRTARTGWRRSSPRAPSPG